MALFKINKGLRENLPDAKTEGYCWYTTDDSLFYIDYVDENNVLVRKALNAKDAETLTGASLSTILNSSDIEIPTSKAVLDAIENVLDAAKSYTDDKNIVSFKIQELSDGQKRQARANIDAVSLSDIPNEVYVGSDAAPEGTVIQFDPAGDYIDLHEVAYSGRYKDLIDALELDTLLQTTGKAADAASVGKMAEVLNTRISNLITELQANPEYSPTAEVVDIRAGYDGIDYETAGDAVRQIGFDLIALKTALQDYIDKSAVDGLIYDETLSKLWLSSGGEPMGDSVTIVSGGGGSGGSSQYSITLSNLLDSRAITTSKDSVVNLVFNYVSIDDQEQDDGNGVGTLSVNDIKVSSFPVKQGENTVDISSYLTSGTNSVKIKVENSEGASRTLSYTVNVITLTLTTTFNNLATYNGDVTFTYTLTGSGTKNIHFLIDDEEIGVDEILSSGRSLSRTIPAQSEGAHILTVYADVIVDEVTVKSNTLTVGMIWISDTMSAPAILSTFDVTTAVQGENITIPYMVYDPQTESAAVTLSVIDADGEQYSSKPLTVDRTEQEWVVSDYPVGGIKFRISCGDTYIEFPVTVSESDINTDPITDALAFYFDPTGRSNLEDDPEQWTDGSVSAEFTDVAFTAADGWLTDADGASILRILPGGQVTIPYKLFESDARSSGATVEVEMATHNVRDYDTVVMSCLSGGRGFKIASQYAQLKSEQSEVSMQFKEDEKVRVSFVIEPRNLHRMIYIYVDGIMCGAVQYPSDDNFAQSPAEGITIGAESSGIDIYRIRMYTKGLTRHEILDNYIADRATLSERIELAKENNIFNEAGDIVISKLPITVPYMIISCPELPQYKDDKKSCTIEYVNPSDTSRSFIAYNAQIDVQGTSSSGYKKKNWKIKLKNGITYTLSGQTAEKYQLRAGEIPTAVFCMKADVASSEGANNVELVRLYNDTVPHKTPAQEADSRARVGIDGLPCIIFWQNTDTGEVRFWGKYNFNYDKGSEEVFGLTAGCESWEIKNNTSNRVLFKSSDFTGTAWTDDFEARYPDGYTNTAKLKAMCDWVVSTDRSAVSTDEEKAARLEKFKNEFEDHFILEPMLFYYIFTETFLMVDNRAKNFFPTTFDGVHWFPFPYDFDTAIGINNEGQLAFDYDLEDTDTVNGDNVFNGQESVLWNNVRDAFSDEIAEMYADIRGTTGTAFDYSQIVKRFADHQAVWVKAIWNEDAWEKYLEPLENDNDASYLAMLQGDKSAQREWWLYNGFRYRDSKYQCGDAEKNYITLRCYEVGNITVTPYSHIHPRIKYGSYTVTERGKRNVPTTLVCPLDKMDDTEVYIYSSDRLAAIGDLSHLQVGYANFSMATKLQSLKLGDGSDTYENLHLTELYVGNNELLTSLDVRNCKNLAMTVDLSGCVGIEEIKAKDSAVTGFTLPVGGRLKSLEIPNTVTNLTMRDLAQFETLNMAGYDELTTFRIENTPNVPYEQIINNSPKLDRVRLIGVEWQATSEATLQTSITKLKTCIGLDAAGDNTTAAVVTGRVYVPSISAGLLTEINEAFPQLVVVADGIPQYVVRYVDWNNTVLYRDVVDEGATAVNAVTAGYISAPTREGTEDTGYAFRDFGTLPTNIHSNVTVVAQYDVTYRVRFLNEGTVYNTQWITSGGSAVTPSGTPTKASTAQYSYTFSRWSGSYTNVTKPVDVTAVYTSTVRTYTVYFYVGNTLWDTVYNVPYGSTATPKAGTPADPDDPTAEFMGWSPSNMNIKGNTSCYAQFKMAWVDPVMDVSAAYAVQWNYADTDSKLARGGLAAGFGLPTPATALDGTGSSPFDDIMPWAGMKKYNIIDGAVAYSEDDEGFDMTAYDTVVYIPEFYYCAEKDTDGKRWTWAISPTPLDGYEKHPGSGRYIGRYHTSSAYTSVSGVAPLASITRAAGRTNSHAKGDNWWQMDFATWCALELLYLVEFADWDSQTVLGTGHSTGSKTNTGGTDGAVYHTLKRSGASNMYRNIENPYSNLRTWCDGFVASERAVYAGLDNSGFGDTTANLTASDITLPSSNYISGYGYSDEFPWAFIPDTAQSNSSAYVRDYVYSNSGVCVLCVGGYYNSNANYGFFYAYASDSASYSNSIIGSRLLYNP